MNDSLSSRSLEYHRSAPSGKLSVESSKPCETQLELSLAYSPGVAAPCTEIAQHPEDVWTYTGRGNSIAVVSDGTAVLGLGNIGPEAAMPVMEGKAVLFKRFAGINATPICLRNVFDDEGRTDPDKLIAVTAALAPTFGGINLEDIGAPACFEVEQRLKELMPIPVFHDDQHGTAIISLAGILNALTLVDKKIADIRVVVNGAGAAGIACSEFYISAGVRRENVTICDSRGVVYEGRDEGMSPQKAQLATRTSARSLAEALEGADVFLGLSVAGCLTPEMVRSMARDPIIFAMANPVPEIDPADAEKAGAFVVGTGRSDYPNQVNNVLGFPGIFRGALDTRATNISEGMKMAAAQALAEVAREPVAGEVRTALEAAYPEDADAGLFDGNPAVKPQYVIPKPFDVRVVPRVARRVAEAAMLEELAREPLVDLESYEKQTFDFINS